MMHRIAVIALSLSTLVFASAFAYQLRENRQSITLTQLDRLHITTSDGLLHASFNDRTVELTMTPRAAIGMHHELGRMIQMVHGLSESID